ncbi:hypothetical protein GGR57DRAFT_460468 [Xylariaceae sp. FL1272]|nr:hypothetical protein GGR57DRAFT_460468 [Xylariaceae sp. FL1272]
MSAMKQSSQPMNPRSSVTAQVEEDLRQRSLHARPSPRNFVSVPENVTVSHRKPPFPQRIYEAASEDLLIFLRNLDKTEVAHLEINLATLQRMNIHAIQKDLVDLVSTIARNQALGVTIDQTKAPRMSEASRLRLLMKDYCGAIRDWDTIVARTSTVEHDPFRISTHEELSRELFDEGGFLMEDFLRNRLPTRGRGRHLERIPLALQKPTPRQLPGEARHAKHVTERRKEAVLRFAWVVAGSLFILAPILLMVLFTLRLASLLVTFISIILFAFVVSGISEDLIPGIGLDNFGLKDALASTLAYAAVLVVFLGLRA